MANDYGILKRIGDHEALIGIIGMGYVGLPLALTCAQRSFNVIGFDIDKRKIQALGKGESYIKHIESAPIRTALDSGRLTATDDFTQLRRPDILIICVPTPLTEHRDPDMSYIIGNAGMIRDNLRAGQLIVLESTTYPGTTDGLLQGILEESGLRCGSDFFLAFSPEREDPGNPVYTTSKIPKVVGGVDELSGELAAAFYEQVVERVVRVKSAREAEATKLTENIFRAINIALVNELKIIYERMNIDVWEVLDAAETKPFGFMRFNPGPGWGGHCIPVDPFYLTWKAREFGLSTRFIELAGEVNITMPHWIIERLQHYLNQERKALNGSTVLVVGLAYKKDIDDTRESPALEILDLLEDYGAEVSYHDPYIPRVPVTRKHPDRAGQQSVTLTPETVAAFDAVVIITDHECIDYELLARNARLLLDSRGVYHRKFRDLKHLVKTV